MVSASASLTRSILTVTLGARSYTNITIKGTIQPKGGNSNSFPLSNLSKYAHTLITADTINEGDRVTDANTNLYEVLHKDDYMYLDQDDSRIAELIKLTAVTLKTLSLGAADTVTGLYAVSYVDSNIYMNIAPKGQSTIRSSAGYNVRYDYIGVTSALVYAGDIITDDNSVNYKVEHVTPYKTQRTDGFTYQVCALIQMDYEEAPSISGTWHLDSTSVKTDPRNRIKTVIDTYLTAANIKKDDGATNASTITCFDGASYPISRLFLTKTVDAVAVISRGSTSTLYTDRLSGHKPYAFEEGVKIEIYAINKSGITASNLAEKYEQEIRRIFTTYDPYSTVRDLDTIEPSMIDLGYIQMCKTGVTIRYKRPNDDYTNSGVTITYGASQANTFTIPNIIKSNLPLTNNDNFQRMPTRLGQYPFMLGSDSMDLFITVDLSVGNWLRPQGSASKTDVFPHQVFLDIMGSAGTQAYQTLDVGWMSFAVRLVKLDPVSDGNSHEVTLSFKEYNATPANTTYTTRWGI